MRIKSNINLGSLLGGSEVGSLSAPCFCTASDALPHSEHLWRLSFSHHCLHSEKRL